MKVSTGSFRTPSLSRIEFQGYSCPSSETKYISTLVPLHISGMINRRALTYCITMVRGQPIICAAQIHLSNQNQNQSITCYCYVVERSYLSYGHVCGSEKYGTSSNQPYYETANKTLEEHWKVFLAMQSFWFVLVLCRKRKLLMPQLDLKTENTGWRGSWQRLGWQDTKYWNTGRPGLLWRWGGGAIICGMRWHRRRAEWGGRTIPTRTGSRSRPR